MLLKKKPILQHIIEFLGHCKLCDKIVVAIPTSQDDDKIETLLKKIGVDCFRGSPNDVLFRYYECAKQYKADLVVRITGDNPLIDPVLVDRVIQVCKETKCEYASNMLNQTYPLGYLVEALTFQTLKKLHEEQKDPMSREHVTYHIRKNPKSYDVKEIYAPDKFTRPNWRLTVDYKEDFDLISEIYSKLYQINSFISYESVIILLEKNKSLLKINQKYYT